MLYLRFSERVLVLLRIASHCVSASLPQSRLSALPTSLSCMSFWLLRYFQRQCALCRVSFFGVCFVGISSIFANIIVTLLWVCPPPFFSPPSLQDWLCDVFLGLRFCFCGIYSMATCMIVTLNHGNINVIFSIVALSFILDIDGDCRLSVLHASAVSAACVGC
jgi:hypothetical protein